MFMTATYWTESSNEGNELNIFLDGLRKQCKTYHASWVFRIAEVILLEIQKYSFEGSISKFFLKSDNKAVRFTPTFGSFTGIELLIYFAKTQGNGSECFEVHVCKDRKSCKPIITFAQGEEGKIEDFFWDIIRKE